MAIVIFWVIVLSSLLSGHVLMRAGRVRAVVLILAASVIGYGLIRSFAGSLPDVHRVALVSLGAVWLVPFCGGFLVGALTGLLRRAVQKTA
mgnify:CR=1 FL=1